MKMVILLLKIEQVEGTPSERELLPSVPVPLSLKAKLPLLSAQMQARCTSVPVLLPLVQPPVALSRPIAPMLVTAMQASCMSVPVWLPPIWTPVALLCPATSPFKKPVKGMPFVPIGLLVAMQVPLLTVPMPSVPYPAATLFKKPMKGTPSVPTGLLLAMQVPLLAMPMPAVPYPVAAFFKKPMEKTLPVSNSRQRRNVTLVQPCSVSFNHGVHSRITTNPFPAWGAIHTISDRCRRDSRGTHRFINHRNYQSGLVCCRKIRCIPFATSKSRFGLSRIYRYSCTNSYLFALGSYVTAVCMNGLFGRISVEVNERRKISAFDQLAL
jgi:hypothetical protein